MMAGENDPQLKPLTYDQARTKYIAEQERELNAPAPWGGEREERFRAAGEKVDAVLKVLRVHRAVEALSDGRSGILSSQQLEAIDGWHVAYAGIIAFNHEVSALMREGTAFGLVEGQITDLETIGDEGLKLFEQPRRQ